MESTPGRADLLDDYQGARTPCALTIDAWQRHYAIRLAACLGANSCSAARSSSLLLRVAVVAEPEAAGGMRNRAEHYAVRSLKMLSTGTRMGSVAETSSMPSVNRCDSAYSARQATGSLSTSTSRVSGSTIQYSGTPARA